MTRLAKKNEVVEFVVGIFRTTTIAIDVVYKYIFTFFLCFTYLTSVIISFINPGFVSTKTKLLRVFNNLLSIISVIFPSGGFPTGMSIGVLFHSLVRRLNRFIVFLSIFSSPLPSPFSLVFSVDFRVLKRHGSIISRKGVVCL